MSERIIIVGAGHAGGQCAIQLRQAKYEGEILLIGQEPHLPYERPPLSKAMLQEGIDEESLWLRKQDYFPKHDIQLCLEATVSRIDTEQQRIVLADGQEHAYDRLVLATGGKVRTLPTPTDCKPYVHYLRTIEDAAGIRQSMAPGRKVIIIGGGYIGLEVAASLRKQECDVQLLEAADRLMSRSVGEEISQFYHQYHEQQGVSMVLQAQVEQMSATDQGVEVLLANGQSYQADMLLVGIGIQPDTELAAQAGLEIDNGIVVDEHGRTSDPHVYAIGDVASFPNEYAHQRVRLESVQNAVGQARVVAKTLAGSATTYSEVPWFWSDQYDLKLQMTGLFDASHTKVVRGTPEEGAFAVWYLDGQQARAVHAVNRPKDFMFGKQFIARNLPLDLQKLREADANLKEVPVS